MTYHVTWTPSALPLEFAFSISRSTKTVAQTVWVRLESTVRGQAWVAEGEAVPSEFYGETPDSVGAFYQRLVDDNALARLDPFNQQGLEHRLAKYPGNMAAKSGLEIAFWDLRGQVLGLPLYALWGLDPAMAPKTSYTIGIADKETVRHKTQVALARGYDILKIKVGQPDHIALVRIIRELAPHCTLRVDANAAYTVEQALALLPQLKELGVEFVEEPLRLDSSPADYAQLKAQSPLPLMADESCHTLADLSKCAAYFDSINLKHTKTGGLAEAMRMIHAARALGLPVMLGGFCESSLSVTAFGHLSPLTQYADLDAALLLANDPYDGIAFEGSQIMLPNRPGVGAVRRTN
jgi:L-alanine-DL-glutamate epimerase-like enolase superfamily enzyme